jgi:deoxycytidylate deaminase
MLINAGVIRVVISNDYNDPLSKEMLSEAKIEVIVR